MLLRLPSDMVQFMKEIIITPYLEIKFAYLTEAMNDSF